MEPKDVVRLKKRDFKLFGVDAPKGLSIREGDTSYFLKYGQDFIVSAHCDPDNKIASLDRDGMPMIHINFLEANNEQFTLIKKHEED